MRRDMNISETTLTSTSALPEIACGGRAAFMRMVTGRHPGQTPTLPRSCISCLDMTTAALDEELKHRH